MGSTCLKHHQDEAGTLLDSDIPDMGRPADALPALPAQRDSNASPGLGNTSVVSSFKLFGLILFQYNFRTLQNIGNDG